MVEKTPEPIKVSEKKQGVFNQMEMVRHEIAALQEKQLTSKLDFLDTKRLEMLLKMDRQLRNTPEENEKIDDAEYSDEEVERFIENIAKWKNNGKA